MAKLRVRQGARTFEQAPASVPLTETYARGEACARGAAAKTMRQKSHEPWILFMCLSFLGTSIAAAPS
jgi:hypothetical protein